MRHYILGRDTLLSTIFVFLVTGLLGLLAVNIHVFDPFKRSFLDFELTDIYYSQIRNENASVDTNIVIINIDHFNRDSIAMVLQSVSKQNPKAVGMDLIFSGRREFVSDSLLKSAFATTKNLVLAGSIIRDNDGRDQISATHPWFGKYPVCYANLAGDENNTSIIREYRPFAEVEDSLLPSFTSEIIKKANLKAWDKLREKGNHYEIINYSGGINSFLCIDAKDILDSVSNRSILKDKIILIGYIGDRFTDPQDLEDLHFTPMNPKVTGRAIPDMRGVLIHANIISMALRDDYIRIIPSWINWLLAFVLCYLHIALFIYLYLHRHKWYHFSAKWLQFISSVLLIWISFIIYKHFHIKFSVVPSVVVIMLSMDLLYFYEGMVTYLALKFNFRSIFQTQNH